MTKADELSAFLDSLGRLPNGFARGSYGGSAYGVTIDRSTGCTKLFARELGGREIDSFNLYRTRRVRFICDRAKCLRPR